MSKLDTIARPYAKAIFELAQSEDTFDKWSDTLALIKFIVEDENIQHWINNPFADKKEIADIINLICKDKIDQSGANFINELASNRRFNAIDAIVQRYDVLRAQAESVVEAQVESAIELNSEQIETLKRSLESHFGKNVKINTSIDETHLGGVLIRAGDSVIDGTVRTKLEKLASTIRA